MCMSLERRVQILLDEPQYARLEREARRRGGSVASVIRDAVDRLLPPGSTMSRSEAGDLLLAAEPIDVGDWAEAKEDLLDPMGT